MNPNQRRTTMWGIVLFAVPACSSGGTEPEEESHLLPAGTYEYHYHMELGWVWDYAGTLTITHIAGQDAIRVMWDVPHFDPGPTVAPWLPVPNQGYYEVHVDVSPGPGGDFDWIDHGFALVNGLPKCLWAKGHQVVWGDEPKILTFDQGTCVLNGPV